MTLMKAAQISCPGSNFEVVEREIPEPGYGQVLIQVQACGICHGDEAVKQGYYPGIEYPRIPGHEIAGIIHKVGEGVAAWRVGQRVGVGWHGGHCFQCAACREGDFVNCQNALVCGIHYDGGFAEYMVAPQEALALIPDQLSAVEAAPLVCAGITTYNALRNSGAKAGDIVAVQGLGGLGHLGVQFANKLGFKTVAISRGQEKQELAKKLGAHVYIDTEVSNVAGKLAELGGAQTIIATAPNGKSISALVGGLANNGKLIVVAAPGEAIEIAAMDLITGRRSIQGWYSGDAKDSEETLQFSAFSGILPQVETYKLEQINEAYDRMITGKVRFRAVIVFK